MKASDITKPGFYWQSRNGEWAVIEATMASDRKGIVFWIFGRDDEFTASEMDEGLIIGPIEPPTLGAS